MEKWEYLTLERNGHDYHIDGHPQLEGYIDAKFHGKPLVAVFNELGNEGWELICYANPYGAEGWIFKRRIPDV